MVTNGNGPRRANLNVPFLAQNRLRRTEIRKCWQQPVTETKQRWTQLQASSSTSSNQHPESSIQHWHPVLNTGFYSSNFERKERVAEGQNKAKRTSNKGERQKATTCDLVRALRLLACWLCWFEVELYLLSFWGKLNLHSLDNNKSSTVTVRVKSLNTGHTTCASTRLSTVETIHTCIGWN